MSELFSILDDTFCDASLSITNGGMELSPNTGSTTAHRMCRCTEPLGDTVSQYEVLIYGTGSLLNGSLGAVYIGIVNSSAVTSKYVSEDANGYAFNPYDGKLYHNGSSVATFSTCALNDFVSIQVNFDASPQTIAVLKNGVLLGTYALLSTGTWYPALTVSGGAAGALSLFFNAGQRAFRYPISGITGWWDSLPQPATIYMATFPYLSLPTDLLASQRFDAVKGAIIGDTSLAFPRSAEFWIDAGDSKATTALSTMSVEDPDGTYDYIFGYRNATIKINSVDGGSSYNTAQQEDTVILDRVESKGDQSKQIYLADPIAQILSLPMTTAYFPPNVDISVVDTPMPVLNGTARNFTPICEDTTNLIYRMSDKPIGAIGAVRVQGKPLVFGTDYTLLVDGCRFQLAAAPAGTLTVEATSVVQGIPGGGTDLLAGIGNFDSQSTSATFLANWTTAYAGNDAASSNIAAWVASSGSIPSAIELHIVSTLNYNSSVRTNTNVCQAGKTYAAVLVFTNTAFYCPQQPLGSSTSVPSYFFVDGHHLTNQYNQVDNWGIQYTSIYYGPGGHPSGGSLLDPAAYVTSGNNIQCSALAPDLYRTVTVTFTNTGGSDLPLVLNFQNGNGGFWRINNAKLYLLPDALNVVPLTGETLQGYMRNVLSRAGVSEGQWDSTQAAAIDTATGYQIGKWFSNSVTTVQDALKPALDTFGAGVYRKRDGRMGVVRLIDPSTVMSPTGSLDENDMLAEPYIYLDVMRGITTGRVGRKNYTPLTESDFANVTTTAVPIALRKLLERNYQTTYTSGAQLAEPYAQGQLGSPFESLMDLSEDMMIEGDRIGALGATAKLFYSLTVSSPPGTIFEIGDVWAVTYKWNSTQTARRYGLDAKKLFVCAVDNNPALQQCVLTCWG